MTKRIRIEQPYTNTFGTYNPGDTVLIVTMCTQRVNMYKGRYLGYIERPWGYGANQKMEKFVQAEVDETRYEYQYPDGSKFKWSDLGSDYAKFREMMADGRIVRVAIPYKRITTLQLNRIAPSA